MIKLILENFKCWDKKVLTLPENGIVLLNGKSGVGKTSILQAIYFAIYGKGTNLPRYGSNGKISVQLEFPFVKIKRSKKPNRLTVQLKNGFVLEDVPAQEHLNKAFGTNFEVTSYIQQKGLNSFLTSSPAEKLEFLERMISNEFDITNFKTKLKSLISAMNKEHQTIQGENSTLKELVGKSKSYLKEQRENKEYQSNVYSEVKTVESLQEKKKNWTVKKSNAVLHKNKDKDKLVILFEKIKENEKNHVRKTYLESQIKEIETKLIEHQEQQKNLKESYTTVDMEKYESLKQQKNDYYDNIKHVTLLKQFESELEREKKKIEKGLSSSAYLEPWSLMTLEECQREI